jgi:hypothetical protein
MSKNSGQKSELCRAEYWAYQIGDTLTLFAAGQHPTLGHQILLEGSVNTGVPAEYSLRHVAPEEPSGTALAPFLVSVSVEASAGMRSVTVHDADGDHTVDVHHIRNCDG